LLGGNDFHGLIQTEPAGGPPGSAILRQADFSLCLLHPELDELREIQNAINCKRPRTGELEEWSFVTFGYFGLEECARTSRSCRAAFRTSSRGSSRVASPSRTRCRNRRSWRG
jgi:hypothetical protein